MYFYLRCLVGFDQPLSSWVLSFWRCQGVVQGSSSFPLRASPCSHKDLFLSCSFSAWTGSLGCSDSMVLTILSSQVRASKLNTRATRAASLGPCKILSCASIPWSQGRGFPSLTRHFCQQRDFAHPFLMQLLPQ